MAIFNSYVKLPEGTPKSSKIGGICCIEKSWGEKLDPHDLGLT